MTDIDTTDLGIIVDDHTVRFECLLPGPIERVWDFLTRREHLKTWLADGDIAPCVGTRFELSQQSEGVPFQMDVLIRGVVALCEPPSVLAFTWNPVSLAESAGHVEGPESIVTIELIPRGEDVLLVLTHQRVLTDFLSKVGAGWHTLLGFLRARMIGEEPEPAFTVYNRVLARYVH